MKEETQVAQINAKELANYFYHKNIDRVAEECQWTGVLIVDHERPVPYLTLEKDVESGHWSYQEGGKICNFPTLSMAISDHCNHTFDDYFIRNFASGELKDLVKEVVEKIDSLLQGKIGLQEFLKDRELFRKTYHESKKAVMDFGRIVYCYSTDHIRSLLKETPRFALCVDYLHSVGSHASDFIGALYYTEPHEVNGMMLSSVYRRSLAWLTVLEFLHEIFHTSQNQEIKDIQKH